MRAFLCICAFALLCLLSLAPARNLSHGQGTGKKPPTKEPTSELDELKRFVENQNVTIFLQNNPAMLKGRITGSVEFFGKRFLVLTRTTGGKTLVNTEVIAAIQQD